MYHVEKFLNSFTSLLLCALCMHTRKHCLTKKQRKNNNLTFLNNENTFLEHSITAALQVHVLQKKYKRTLEHTIRQRCPTCTYSSQKAHINDVHTYCIHCTMYSVLLLSNTINTVWQITRYLYISLHQKNNVLLNTAIFLTDLSRVPITAQACLLLAAQYLS